MTRTMIRGCEKWRRAIGEIALISVGWAPFWMLSVHILAALISVAKKCGEIQDDSD